MAGNQWALVTWRLNKLRTGDAEAYTSGCFLPTEPCPIPGAVQLDSANCFRVQAHVNKCTGSRLCEGKGPLPTAQVILLPAEASLKPISCGIINSFRSIKGPVHTRGELDGPEWLLFARNAVAHFLKCSNYHKEEMLQKYHAEDTLNILCYISIILDVEPSVCSYIRRRTETEKTPQEFSLASVLISIPLLYMATGAVLVAWLICVSD